MRLPVLFMVTSGLVVAAPKVVAEWVFFCTIAGDTATSSPYLRDVLPLGTDKQNSPTSCR